MICLIFLVLAHWKNSLVVDISLHALSWFLAYQSLVVLFNAACFAEKQQIPISLSLIWTDSVSKPLSTILEASTLTITLSTLFYTNCVLTKCYSFSEKPKYGMVCVSLWSHLLQGPDVSHWFRNQDAWHYFRDQDVSHYFWDQYACHYFEDQEVSYYFWYQEVSHYLPSSLLCSPLM